MKEQQQQHGNRFVAQQHSRACVTRKRPIGDLARRGFLSRVTAGAAAALALVLLLLFGALTGCGGGSGDDDDTVPVLTAVPERATARAALTVLWPARSSSSSSRGAISSL